MGVTEKVMMRGSKNRKEIMTSKPRGEKNQARLQRHVVFQIGFEDEVRCIPMEHLQGRASHLEFGL